MKRAEATGKLWQRVRSMVRRMTVATSEGGLWTLVGYPGEPNEVREAFGGIGWSARPGAGGEPEAIVLSIGVGPRHKVIIALRDESTRLDIEPDETAAHNSLSKLHILKTGKIQAGSRQGGTFEPGIRAHTYRAAEDTLLGLLSALATQLNGEAALAAGTKAAASALAAGITTFINGGASHKTAKWEAE